MERGCNSGDKGATTATRPPTITHLCGLGNEHDGVFVAEMLGPAGQRVVAVLQRPRPLGAVVEQVLAALSALLHHVRPAVRHVFHRLVPLLAARLAQLRVQERPRRNVWQVARHHVLDGGAVPRRALHAALVQREDLPLVDELPPRLLNLVLTLLRKGQRRLQRLGQLLVADPVRPGGASVVAVALPVTLVPFIPPRPSFCPAVPGMQPDCQHSVRVPNRLVHRHGRELGLQRSQPHPGKWPRKDRGEDRQQKRRNPEHFRWKFLIPLAYLLVHYLTPLALPPDAVRPPCTVRRNRVEVVEEPGRRNSGAAAGGARAACGARVREPF